MRYDLACHTHCVSQCQLLAWQLPCLHAQTRIVALMTVLSQHAPNEHYLSDEDQGFVYVRLVAPAWPSR